MLANSFMNSSYFGGLLGERDADRRAVLRLLAVRRVVHLQPELAPLRQTEGRVRRADEAQVARGPADQDAQVAVRADRVRSSRPAGCTRRRGGRPPGPPAGPRPSSPTCPRSNFGVDDPVLVRQHAVGRDLELLRHREDQVRLAVDPALRPLRSASAGPCRPRGACRRPPRRPACRSRPASGGGRWRSGRTACRRATAASAAASVTSLIAAACLTASS